MSLIRKKQLRDALVDVVGQRVRCRRVLDAMRRVPRHAFVRNHTVYDAYADRALPIGHDVTISQPTVVGMMTEALSLDGTERVLEIGTGSGYQAAVLSLLARHVDTVEMIPELAVRARAALTRLGIDNVDVWTGDGWDGLPECAPFDRILVTAAPDHVPDSLRDQLGEGGVLVVPVGEQSQHQRLQRLSREGRELRAADLGAVRFVPLVRV